MRGALQTDDGRGIATETLGDLLAWHREVSPNVVTCRPYGDLGQSPADAHVADRGRPIFITARFRTGSTLLWNIFRHVDGCTAYEEPLNERRWFDPAVRGVWVDRTHQGVSDYWSEYDGLSELGGLYHRSLPALRSLLPARVGRGSQAPLPVPRSRPSRAGVSRLLLHLEAVVLLRGGVRRPFARVRVPAGDPVTGGGQAHGRGRHHRLRRGRAGLAHRPEPERTAGAPCRRGLVRAPR